MFFFNHALLREVMREAAEGRLAQAEYGEER